VRNSKFTKLTNNGVGGGIRSHCVCLLSETTQGISMNF